MGIPNGRSLPLMPQQPLVPASAVQDEHIAALSGRVLAKIRDQ